jgi:hypothetical protein
LPDFRISCLGCIISVCRHWSWSHHWLEPRWDISEPINFQLLEYELGTEDWPDNQFIGEFEELDSGYEENFDLLSDLGLLEKQCHFLLDKSYEACSVEFIGANDGYPVEGAVMAQYDFTYPDRSRHKMVETSQSFLIWRTSDSILIYYQELNCDMRTDETLEEISMTVELTRSENGLTIGNVMFINPPCELPPLLDWSYDDEGSQYCQVDHDALDYASEDSQRFSYEGSLEDLPVEYVEIIQTNLAPLLEGVSAEHTSLKYEIEED